ncbi:MAG TPA: D-cysteine desulfhydrase family protein [bacterium]|nr:D-cysteine desulfhydrase family protein [bacterium]
MRNLWSLPRVPLVRTPTPLEDAPRLAAALGVGRLLVKREDLTDLALGGNKVRKLEFLFGDALAQRADTIITTASAHSNFLRIVSAGARRFGMRAILAVRGRADLAPEGNLLLMRLFADRIVYLDTEDPYADSTIAEMRRLEQEIKDRGGRPYVIHLAAFSAGLATVGYVPAAQELAAQLRERELECDRIVLAVGSGGTHAGLLLGLRASGVAARVLGASVNTAADEMHRRVRDQIRAAEDILGLPPTVRDNEIEITDAHVGPGYGIPTVDSLHAVALAARAEGLLLDPIYTGKAWAALAHAVRTGAVTSSDTVVFVHTGGAPNNFVHGKEIADSLAAAP